LQSFSKVARVAAKASGVAEAVAGDDPVFEFGAGDVLLQAVKKNEAVAAMTTIEKRFILGFSEPSSVNFLRDAEQYITPFRDRFCSVANRRR
jgi:hypothetical protein